MNLKSRKLRVTLILMCALLICGLGGSLGAHLSVGSGGSTIPEESGMISLSRPVFAQGAGTTFLDEEAGAAAYMNAGQTLDISKARDCYRTIEKETDTYIIGSMQVGDLPESEDVHCYVHVDGWIVTYYLKEEPLSKIVAWEYYLGGELTTTKLDEAVGQMASCLQVPVPWIKHYHFQFPSANNWMIITKSQYDEGTSSFNLQIPMEFTVYERSWSHGARPTSSSYTMTSYLKIGATTISTISGYFHGLRTEYGMLAFGDLPPGDFHEVSVTGSGNSFDSAHIAICLVYLEP